MATWASRTQRSVEFDALDGGRAIGRTERQSSPPSVISPPAKIRSSKETLRLKLYGCLLALDVSAIVLGFAIGNTARFGDLLDDQGIQYSLAFLPFYLLLAFSKKAYCIKALATPREGIVRALKAFALTACALLLVFFYLKTSAQVSRAVFGVGFSAGMLFIFLFRHTFGKIIGRRYNWSFINEVVLVDGMSMLPARGQIVLFAQEAGLSPTVNDPQSFDRIGSLLGNCDRVILACPPESRLAWTRTLRGVGISVEVLTPELDHLNALELRHASGRSSVVVALGPLGLRDRLLKRALDLAITLPALVAVAPLMLTIAIGIKVTSAGPVFFRQPRVGQANRIFQVLKFRSMRVEAADSAGVRSASKDDDRITPIGRFLRRSSLDELPQLLNVLAGDMSIVGPRPHALASTAEDCLFWHIDSRYWERGAVKPGITGLAQVRGFRGATTRREDLTNRLQADLEYLMHWTIWRDIMIILRTAKVMIHPNAF